MSWIDDVILAACTRAASVGAGTFPDSPVVDGSIVRGTIPADIATGVGVQGYRVGPDDPQNPTTQLRVQFWLRAPSLSQLDDLDAALYDGFHGLQDVALGSAMLAQASSLSAIPQGVDGNGNYERSCNYTFDLDLPATALRSY